MPNKQAKKITLADLGVKTENTIPKEEQTEEVKKSTIITPNMVGGLAKKDGNPVSINIDEKFPKTNDKPKNNFMEDKYNLIDSRLNEEKEKIKKEILDPLKEKCDTEKLKYELEIGRPLEKGEDPAYDESGNPIDPKLKNKESDIADPIQLDTPIDVEESDFDGLTPVEPTIRKELDANLSSTLDTTLDDDIDDLLSDELQKNDEDNKESDEEAKLQLKELQNTIKEATNKNIPDVSKFKVSSAPISVTKIFSKKIENKIPTETTATVPLLNSGRLITLSSLRGDEIVALDPDTYGKNRLNQLRNIYSIIYKHDVSPKKPDTFLKWLKSICDFDSYQLYWALYKATFKDSNYITYECPDCGSIFMQQKPIDSMCRISPATSDAIKEKIKNLEETGTDIVLDSLLSPNIIPISTKYALGLKAPSIYANLFETSMLEQKYLDKYGQIISIIPYVDSMYYINSETNSLVPIDFGEDPNNATRTVKHKIGTLYKIVKDITTDEYAALSSHVLNISMHQHDAFEYITPATDCTGQYKKGQNKGKDCHHHFEEEIMDTPLRLLFSRQQLVVSANFITE